MVLNLYFVAYFTNTIVFGRGSIRFRTGHHADRAGDPARDGERDHDVHVPRPGEADVSSKGARRAARTRNPDLERTSLGPPEENPCT